MSRLYDRAVVRLREMQLSLADESLRRPQTANIAYEYGRVVGLYAGLEKAIVTITDLVTEDEEYENSSRKR